MNKKPLHKSKRFWGLVIVVLGAILKGILPQHSEIIDFGVKAGSEAFITDLITSPDTISNITMCAGAILNLLGQAVAKAPLITNKQA